MNLVLIIPGLNGSPRLLANAASQLFPGMEPVLFDHSADLADDGVGGLAERAWALAAERACREPIYVAGESFGGPVALEVARRHTEQVSGLILFSTFARYPTRAARSRRPGLALWDRIGSRAGAAILKCVRPFEVPGQLGLRASPRLALDLLRLPHDYGPGYREKCRLSLEFDAEPWLPHLRVPALVAVPRWDLAVPPEAGLALAAALPLATLLRLPGGHLTHLVHAAQVGAMLEQWRRAAALQRAGQLWPSCPTP